MLHCFFNHFALSLSVIFFLVNYFFFMQAALGTPRLITKDGQVGWNDSDPASEHGAHSCVAVGRTEPDPKNDLTVNMDGRDVVVPQVRGEPQFLTCITVYSSLAYVWKLCSNVSVISHLLASSQNRGQ